MRWRQRAAALAVFAVLGACEPPAGAGQPCSTEAGTRPCEEGYFCARVGGRYICGGCPRAGAMCIETNDDVFFPRPRDATADAGSDTEPPTSDAEMDGAVDAGGVRD